MNGRHAEASTASMHISRHSNTRMRPDFTFAAQVYRRTFDSRRRRSKSTTSRSTSRSGWLLSGLNW
jgi:hypothetical protein